MGYYYGYGAEHMFGWGLFGVALMVLVWVIIIAVIVGIVRRIIWGRRMGRHWMFRHGMMSGSAMEVLRERYAKGEINKEEFEQKKNDLME